MASNYHKSPSKNLGNSSASYESEDYASSANASSEMQETRSERRHRHRQYNIKASVSRKQRIGQHNTGYSVSSASFVLDVPEEQTETLDSSDWPALKPLSKNKKSDKKIEVTDAAVQVDDVYCLEELIYPVWSTKEIVLPIEDDIPMPVPKKNKISRGTQTDDTMFIKHEAPRQQIEVIKKGSKPSKGQKSLKRQQSQKTYADVVIQQEGENYYGPVNRYPPSETKTFLKLKGVKRKQIMTVPKDKAEASSTNSSSKGSEDEKDNSTFNLTSLNKTLPDKSIETMPCELEFCDHNNKDVHKDIPYKEYGDGDSLIKASKHFLYLENEANASKIQKSHNILNVDSASKGNANVKVDDPYNSPEQIKMRAMAEKIAIEGLQPEVAQEIQYELWGRKKSRMAYTRMFSEAEADESSNWNLPMPDLSTPFTVELLSGRQHPASAHNGSHRQNRGRTHTNVDRNQFSINFVAIDENQLYSESWRYFLQGDFFAQRP